MNGKNLNTSILKILKKNRLHNGGGQNFYELNFIFLQEFYSR